MKVLWPFGVALRGEASSRLDTALAEDRCGKRSRKRRRKSRQAGIRKASESEPLRKRRKIVRWHQNRGRCIALGRVWRVPVYWPGGVRREDGASLICGYYTKRGKACADTVLAPVRDRVREGVRQAAATVRR
jgi:hypothetical protein